MTDIPRITLQGLKVLKAFMHDPRRPLSGADIAETAGILSGTLYPLLIRFEKGGWLKSEWEAGDPVDLGRPRKRFYRISGAGQMAYNAASGAAFIGGAEWVSS